MLNSPIIPDSSIKHLIEQSRILMLTAVPGDLTLAMSPDDHRKVINSSLTVD